jgi:nicotinamide mononucleotide (NMN) deamidase PncC
MNAATADLLDRLAGRNVALALVATGGGASAIADLCAVPGASRVVTEGLVPYATAAVDRLLGGVQEQYCSARTARRLAIAAWQRSASMTSPERAMGAAVTASLVTTRPKRGPHRVHAAVQTLDRTLWASVELVKGERDRPSEEAVAASILLAGIWAGLGQGDAADAASARVAATEGVGLLPGERLRIESVEACEGLRALLAGRRRVLDAAALRAGASPEPARRLPAAGGVVFPGSFDPLHDGHRRMAALAEEVAEAPVAFELSVTNVDKPMLDYAEIRARVDGIGGERPLWVTRAATFLEKTEVFPHSTFVMGADTFVRLADPRYTHGSVAEAESVAGRIAEAVRGLIVFGRLRDGRWIDPAAADVPEQLRRKTLFMSRREFAMEISSTALRAAAGA